MKWWQLYYAIKDGWELQKQKGFEKFGYEVFITSSWFLEKDIYRYPLADRIALWGRAVAKLLTHKDTSYLNRTRQELNLFYERLQPLLKGGGRGSSPQNIEFIHAFLVKTFNGDVEKVYNLSLWEVAEILNATHQLLKLQKENKK